MLELREVSKSFGRLQVLANLSFSLREGEALGVLGPNGAGKTTMLNLISGDLRVGSGQILLRGGDITREPAPVRCHRGIGRTYQIPRPFVGMTVFENVLVGATYGRGPERRDRDTNEVCHDVLQLTGLLERADVLAGNLGLLERKRLELARALATRPSLLHLLRQALDQLDPKVDGENAVHHRQEGVHDMLDPDGRDVPGADFGNHLEQGLDLGPRQASGDLVQEQE